jgi:hypothetical protein
VIIAKDNSKISAKYRMGHHYQKYHKDLILPEMTGFQYFYYLLTGKENGSCVICKKETMFNERAMKYSRFCENPVCKDKYREQFKNRMISKYGKVHLLNDIEKQKEMLSKRGISGVYKWSDKNSEFKYVGSYELDFLKFLDIKLQWKSSDILAPSPHTYVYEYNKEEHKYIPDFFIPSENLEIEIKDDGSNKIINQDTRNKDKIKEELMRSNINYFNYILIVNKNYDEFLNFLQDS